MAALYEHNSALNSCICYGSKVELSIRVRSFGTIRIWINDPRSLGSWRIKGTDESALGKVLSVPLMRHDPSDLGSLIQIRIIPKELALCIHPTVRSSIHPTIHPSIHLSVCLSVYLSIYLSHLSVYLSVCLSVYLTIIVFVVMRYGAKV